MNPIDSLLKAFSKSEASIVSNYKVYLKKLAGFNSIIETQERSLKLVPDDQTTEFEPTLTDKEEMISLIQSILVLLEQVLLEQDCSIPEFGPLKSTFSLDYIDRLKYFDMEFYKTLYIMLKMFRCVDLDHGILRRILEMFAVIYDRNQDFEIAGPLLLVEECVLSDNDWATWLFKDSVRIKRDVDDSVLNILVDLLKLFQDDGFLSLLILNMIGYFIYRGANQVKGLDMLLEEQLDRVQGILTQLMAVHVYHLIDETTKPFLLYPSIFQKISNETDIHGTDSLLYSFGEQDALVKESLDYVVGLYLKSTNIVVWKGAMCALLLQLLRKREKIVDITSALLYSTEWHGIAHESALLLLILLKSNLNQCIGTFSANKAIVGWMLQQYFSSTVIQDPLYQCFCLIKNQPGSKLIIIEYCLENHTKHDLDTHKLLLVLSECIEQIEYNATVFEQLFKLAETLALSDRVDYKPLCRYLNGLVSNQGFAVRLVNLFFTKLQDERIKSLGQYIFVNTRWENLFALLVDEFTKTIEQHISKCKSISHFVDYLTELFHGSLVNEFLVDVMVNFDFIGMLVRMFPKIPKIGGSSAFLSFVNLTGKIISYDSKFVEEFVMAEGYTRAFEAYLDQREHIGINFFVTPLLFGWKGDYFNILHPASVDFVFEIMDKIDPELFLGIFSLLMVNCTHSNLWNMEQCRIAKVFQIMLSKLEYFENCKILDQCSSFIISLLSYHSDFDDVKLLMGLLAKSNSSSSNIQEWTLNIMEKVTRYDRSKIANDYFILTGPESRIEIPVFSKSVVSSKGYSFLLWFRLTDFEFTVFDIERLGTNYHISLVVRGGILVLLVNDSEIETEVPLENSKLELGLWHSVWYCHKIGMFNISNESVYLDSQLVWKGNVSSTQTHSDIQIEIAKQPKNIYPIYISSFAFFNQVISAEMIQTLHFSKESTIPISAELYQFQLLPLNQQPLLFCHPMASFENDFCYNLSSSANAPPHIKLKRTIGVKTRSFPDALQSVGSVEIFYPLLSTPNRESSLGITTVIEDSPSNRNVVHVIHLLASLISNSHFHRSSFIHSKGPKLLSLLLQQIPVQHVNIELLDSLVHLRSVSSLYSGLMAMIDEHLIYEPQIWSRCGPLVQREYFSRLLMSNEPRMQDVTHWLDSFEQFYGGISKEAGSWGFMQTLLSYSLSDSDIIRFSESLWCCIHSPEGPMLYDLFEHMYIVNTPFYEAVLDYNGLDLILRMCQSVHENVRSHALRICIRILLDDEIYTGSLEDEILRLDESVWIDILGSFSVSQTIYVHLISLMLGRTLSSTNSIGETLELEIKYPVFLKVLLELLLVSDCDVALLSRIFDDLVHLISFSSENVNHIKTLGLTSILLRLVNQKVANINQQSKDFQNLVFVMIETLFNAEIGTLISSSAVTELVSLVIFTFPNQVTSIVLMSILDVLLNRMQMTLGQEPSGDSQIRFHEALVVIEELLFYNKDIMSFFQEEFSTSLGDYNFTVQSSRDSLTKSRNSSATPNLMYQPCYPFDEWKQVALTYSKLIQTLLDSKLWNSTNRFFVFPAQIGREVIVVQAVRIILSSLSSFDPDIWSITLEQLHHMIDTEMLSSDSFVSKYALYILGNLYDSSRMEGSFFIYPCLIKLMGLWQNYIMNVERTLSPSAWKKACSDIANLQQYLESSDWLTLYDKHLFKATRSVENEIIGSVQAITKKYYTSCYSFLRVSSKKRSEKVRTVSLARQRVNDSTSMKAEVRKERLSQRLTSYEQVNKEITKVWHFAAQEVVYERRIWNNPDMEKFYSLDITENQFRMRRHLTRNFDGDNHRAASMKRDRIPKNEIESRLSSPFLSLPDRKKIFGQKLSKLSFESGLILENPDQVSLEIEKMILEKSRNYEMQSEICLYSVECEVILFLTKIKGKIEVTNTHFRFFPEDATMNRSDEKVRSHAVYLDELRVFAEHRRPLSSLEKVFLRRHNFKNSALEAFFKDGHVFLFNFSGSEKEADKERRMLINIIKGLRLPHAVEFHLSSPAICLEQSRYTEMWSNGDLSNFEYLMILNTFSGRTYNDLSQYPVFPWIIADYTSTKLDLNDPKTFRDLSKPIGAINEDRLNYFLERYNSFEDPSGEIQKFLYGSHYSSSASVMFYLLRMEPFTTFHISLQGGKFDHADRQFYSFENLWYSVTNSTSDVKELIPEFFYLPDFLRNMNHYDLGTTQSGEAVGDVKLPAWASTPEEFIRINREALESDYVSEHLHDWIDLIWGYKQNGPAAIDANNVFYYLTYEGAVNMDAIENPLDRKSIEDQIHHFGQTPTQLFKFPHPPRTKKVKGQGRFDIQRFDGFDNIDIFHVSVKLNESSVSLFCGTKGVCVNLYSLIQLDAGFELLESKQIQSQLISNRFAPNIQFSTKTIQIHPNGKYVFGCGYFDYTFRVYTMGDSLLFLDRVYAHLDVVTCLSLSSDGELLATGSADSTVRLWKIQVDSGKCTVIRDNKIFYGHDKNVTDVLVSIESHVLITASQDNTVLIHPLHHSGSPTCIDFSKQDPSEIRLFQMPVCGDLLILVSNLTKSVLYRYSINGQELSFVSFSRVLDVQITSDDQLVFISTIKGLEIRNGKTLDIIIHQELHGSAPLLLANIPSKEDYRFVGVNEKEIYSILYKV